MDRGDNPRILTDTVLIGRCNSGENARRPDEDFSKAGHLSIHVPGKNTAWADIAPRIEIAQFRFVCPRGGADRKGGRFFGWGYWPVLAVSKPLVPSSGKRSYVRVCAHQGGRCVAATLVLFSHTDAAKKAENRQRGAEQREERKRAQEEKLAAPSGESAARGGGAKVGCRPCSCVRLIFADAFSVSASSQRSDPALISALVKWQGGGAQRRVTADASAVGRTGDSLFKSLGLAIPGAAPTETQSVKAPAWTQKFTKQDFGRFFNLDMVSDPFHNPHP